MSLHAGSQKQTALLNLVPSAVHYDADSSTDGRKLPLIATARGSILSLTTPQQRFIAKGTQGSFVKYGVDVQESQLVAKGADALKDSAFAKDPEELYGKLYTLEKPNEPVTCASSRTRLLPELEADHVTSCRITSETGNYRAWFENVGEALQANDPSRLIVKPEQAALTIRLIELAEQSSREGRTLDL